MRMARFALLTAVLLSAVGCATTAPFGSGPAEGRRHTATTEEEIAALFDRWNDSLQTGDPLRVVANYAERSILLPTVSDRPRFTPEEKRDYFEHFLTDGPQGTITRRQITLGRDLAVDSGHYTFRFARTGETVEARYTFTYRWDGTQWLIVSHHSSALPGH